MALGDPVPGKIFLGQVNKEMDYIGVVWNEPLIEVGKAKEGLNILHLGGYWPLCNAIEFDRVHGKFTRFDDHTKIFDFRGGKVAFF